MIHVDERDSESNGVPHKQAGNAAQERAYATSSFGEKEP